jgi:hypothetical protein
MHEEAILANRIILEDEVLKKIGELTGGTRFFIARARASSVKERRAMIAPNTTAGHCS